MRYYVLYPKAKNVHLIKDVGMIAYKLNQLFGYESVLACYNNDQYSYLKDQVKGLKLDFIKKLFNNEIINGILYLKKESKNIDVLQLFHVTLSSFFYIFVYKLNNPKGIIFLKLDCTEELIYKIQGLRGLKKCIFKFILKKVHIIGVEQQKLYSRLQAILPGSKNKILYIPNGNDYDSKDRSKEFDYSKKENIIINVGRIGSPEKGSNVLMEAFSKIPDIKSLNWKLVFIGEIEEEFKKYIDKFFMINPDMKDKIIFKNAVYDRKKLFEEYEKSKIFCCSSSFESFGIAMLEAASFGDVIISTEVGIAGEIAEGGNGAIIPKNDPEAAADKLNYFINCKDLEKYSEYTYNLCRRKYDWNEIAAKLQGRLKAIRGDI